MSCLAPYVIGTTIKSDAYLWSAIVERVSLVSCGLTLDHNVGITFLICGVPTFECCRQSTVISPIKRAIQVFRYNELLLITPPTESTNSGLKSGLHSGLNSDLNSEFGGHNGKLQNQ